MLLGWACPAQAAATTPALTVELGVAPDKVPDQVCIVSTAAHPDAQLLQKGGAIGPPNASLRLAQVGLLRPERYRSNPSPTESQVWRFDALPDTATSDSAGRHDPGAQRPGTDTGSAQDEASTRVALTLLQQRPFIAAALEALRAPVDEGSSCEARSVCAPEFLIPQKLPNSSGDPDKLYVMCSPNVRPTGHSEPQVAVLFVNTHTSIQPPLRTITLDGNVVTLGFQANITDQDVFVASVLGGHYSAGGTSASVSRRIVLPLSPRCEHRDVELPYYDARSETLLDVTLTERGKVLLHCNTSIVDGYARVTLPNRFSVEPRMLELKGPNSGLRFAAMWSERVPPENLRTSLRGVSLSWKRDCLYPLDEPCPTARLMESGYDCTELESSDGGSCSYVCDRGFGTVPIRMPQTVRFADSGGTASWTARLAYSGQVVDDYVPPAERSIILRGPSKKDGFWAQDTLWVEQVELLFSSGQTERVPFSIGMRKRIATPNLLCTQSITTRYVSSFPFVPQEQAAKGGIVQLKEPEERRLPFDGHMMVSLGHETKPAWASKSDYVQSFGEGMLGSLGVAMDGGRWASPVFFQGSYEALIGRREFFLETSNGARSPRGAPIVRGLLGGGIGLRLSSTAILLGVTGGISTALLQDDTDALPIHGVLAPVLRTRFFVGGISSLTLTTRYYIFEQQRVIDGSNNLLESRNRNRASIEIGWDFSLGNWIADIFASSMRRHEAGH